MFFSGYCRITDGSRMVGVVADGNMLVEADCCYPNCANSEDCPIAKKIDAFLQEA